MASLSDVVSVLQTQTKNMEDTKVGIDKLVSVIQKQLDEQKSSAGDELEDKIRERRKIKSAPKQPNTFKGGAADSIKQDLGLGFIQKLASWSFGALGSALGAVGVGGAIAGLTPALGKMIGRAFTRGPLAAAILLFGETALTNMFESLDPNDITTDEFKSSIASSLSNAATLGVLGSILGRRLGAALFVGSLIGDGVKSLFDDDTLKSKFLEGFGLNLNFEDFITYGSLVATFFGPMLVGSALRGALGLTAAVGPAGTAVATGAAAKGFKDGFKPGNFNIKGLGIRAGWAGLIAFTGSILGKYIGDQANNEKLGDTISGAVTAAGAGFMLFGPKGAVIAALAYLAWAGVNELANFFNRNEEKYLDNLRKKFKEIEDQDPAGMTPEEVAANLQKANTLRAEIEREITLTSNPIKATKLGAELDEINKYFEKAAKQRPEDALTAYQINLLKKKAGEGNLEAAKRLLANELLLNKGQMNEDQYENFLLSLDERLLASEFGGESSILRQTLDKALQQSFNPGMITSNYKGEFEGLDPESWKAGYFKDIVNPFLPMNTIKDIEDEGRFVLPGGPQDSKHPLHQRQWMRLLDLLPGKVIDDLLSSPADRTPPPIVFREGDRIDNSTHTRTTSNRESSRSPINATATTKLVVRGGGRYLGAY